MTNLDMRPVNSDSVLVLLFFVLVFVLVVLSSYHFVKTKIDS